MRSADEIAAKLLIGNFVAQEPPAAHAATALAGWEAEGGALLDSLQMLHGGSQVAESDTDELLERLGAAVVSEWNILSMPVRRTLFERAARVPRSCDAGRVRAQLARFLHDR